ncbi:MAG TPA: ATP-binding cassette domain-containing protein [Anaerolineae bacterium]|nr:ATP-binding cassette domain-containing protein [Anaerolineae bacterium]
MTTTQSDVLLEIEHVTMAYGATVALNDVTFSVAAGEVHGVVGEDGAGKTTLMKILGGYIPGGEYSGVVRLAGQPLALSSIKDGLRHGIALVPRLLAVFDHMSVAENATMARSETQRRFSLSRRNVDRQAEEVLRRWEISIRLGDQVRDLTPLQRRQLMIANALGVEPVLVVLDEPLAGMPDGRSISGVVRLIRRMAERGVTCLCLARRPVDATLVADHITVLRDGAVVGQWRREDFDEPALATAMASQRAYDPEARARHGDFGERSGLLDQFRWRRGK